MVKEKANELGLTVMLGLLGGAAVTVRVTGTLCGELEAPDDEIMTVPLYVPAARVPGFTETVTLPGVEPLPEADSQLPPELVDAETV